ncbi:MAG: hypothetical protein GY937_04715 [bacterium]|nr:hypothetical protein [bacterium]
MAGEIDFLKIQHLGSDQIVTEARDLYGRWDTLAPGEKREIVEAITEKIVVGDGDIEIHLYFQPPPPTKLRSPEDPSGNRGNKATQLQGLAAAIS